MSRNQSFALESERSIADLQILITCRTFYGIAIAVSRIYKFSLPTALIPNTLVSSLLRGREWTDTLSTHLGRVLR